ncbi:glycerol-1-phosphate dehydrogenase [Cutibacterium acnes JCM 18918]|nr:glycerol-1-phosphate dehydrogenase [Cutibacterium acnes JCM 18918]
MSDEIIAAAVAGAGDTDVVEMGRGVLDRAGNVLAEHMCRARGHNLPALVVADERTWQWQGRPSTPAYARPEWSPATRWSSLPSLACTPP